MNVVSMHVSSTVRRSHLECARVLCNLASVLVVEEGVEEDEIEILVDLQRVFVPVLRELFAHAVETPRARDELQASARARWRQPRLSTI